MPCRTLVRDAAGLPDGVTVTLPADHAWLDQKNVEAALEKSRGNVTKAAGAARYKSTELAQKLRRRGV
jgi:hypothetical protein